MTRLAAAALALAAWALAFEARAQVCPCPATRPPAVALAESDAVFEAQVTGVREGPYLTGTGEPSAGRWVSALVLREWKGATAGTTRLLFTPTRCPVGFETGTTWLVYARRTAQNHDLRVTRCTRTRRASEAREDLASLGIPATQIATAPAVQVARRAARPPARRVVRRRRPRPHRR
ncbi:MAG: hypothetical protein U0324_45935 [Polyangiales bacterium]